ncbi:MAG: substrate-binding domain-containing protein [Gemmataceae bacterium]|nr:substrate-binding domain-containing protein [Gemmataceae bacterium]
MRRWIRRLSVITGLVASILFSGCSSSDSVSVGERPDVAFISNNAHEFWSIAKKGTEAAAKETKLKVAFLMPPQGTSEEQRRFIEDLMNKGVRAIAISPNDSANQVDFFRTINNRIPVIAVDNDIPSPEARRCYIGTDNVAAGRAVGKLIKQHVPPGSKFMIFVGKLDSQNAQERRLGVVTELAGGAENAKESIEKMNRNEYPVKFGDYELLGTMTDDADQAVCRRKAEDTLTKYGDVKCLVGLWAYNPPAILEAVLSQKKAGEVVIIGFDENEETLKGIREGHIVGTVVQDPYNFGYESVKLMAGLIQNEPSALNRPDMNAAKQIFIRHRIINKDGNALPAYQDEKVEAVDPFHSRLKELKGQ